MKTIKQLFLCCALFILFLCLTPAQAQASAFAYDIEKYDVSIRVTPQNTYEITEKLRVNFKEERHGIYRKIPLENEVERADGSTSITHARISDIDCGEDDYSTSRENDNLVIQIGDEDVTLTGLYDYTVSYQYHMGNDVLPDIDEFYFNIIGSGWTDTTISNVTFTIQMPDAFDEENLGMSYGTYGSENYEDLYYYIEDNTIYGELDPSVTLGPRECVTVRLELPEGYFVKTDTTPWFAYIAMVLGILSIIAAFLMWWFIGRDDPVVETVEYHAPDGMNCLELAFAYKGNASNQDVIPLLIELARQGYLTISCENKKGTDFSITLIRSYYDGEKESERLFFNGLKKVATGPVIHKSDLKDKFYKTPEAILKTINTHENKTKLFHSNSLNKGWILFALAVIVFGFAYFLPGYEYSYDWLELVFGLCSIGVFGAGIYMLCASAGQKLGILIGAFLLLLSVGLSYLFVWIPVTYADRWYQIACIFSYITCAILVFFSAFLSKRTLYGTEILGRIRGFKRFLETAEKERLEMLVEENPDYFYEILPYTYVLNVSDKWVKHFKSIACEPPSWYTNDNDSYFDVIAFQHIMHSTLTSATSSMTSSPESASSSGGGLSGGGSGGGGGGSW
ncbi:MAG TPA: hypothetical protein DEO89_02615 [Lachnospiraceae bacterium]|nr:hypothetical protein [Lachnospiraceae bacterium]